MKQKILHTLLPFIVFYISSLAIGIPAWYTTFNTPDIKWSLAYIAPAITGVVFMFNPIAWATFIYATLFVFIFRKRENHKKYYIGLLVGITVATLSSYPLFKEALVF